MEANVQDVTAQTFLATFEEIFSGQISPEVALRYWNGGRFPSGSLASPNDPHEVKSMYRARNASIKALRRARGKRYASCSLASFKASTPKAKAVQAKMAEFCDNLPENIDSGANLLLYGTVGTGKDHLLMAAMLEAGRFGYVPMWMNGADLFARFRETFDQNSGESVRSVIAQLAACDVLAISDPLPPGNLTDFQKSNMLELIDRRYSENKPVWITCNVSSRAELDSRLGEAACDRLVDGAIGLFCEWETYRRSGQ